MTHYQSVIPMQIGILFKIVIPLKTGIPAFAGMTRSQKGNDTLNRFFPIIINRGT
jgi:hypothetical protein